MITSSPAIENAEEEQRETIVTRVIADLDGITLECAARKGDVFPRVLLRSA